MESKRVDSSTFSDNFPTMTKSPPTFRASFFCEQGTVREQNEDAALCKPEAGLYVIADGMGGHEQGDYASQTICNELDAVNLEGDLDQRVSILRQHLFKINSQIFAYAEKRNIVCGSTVVILVTKGEEAAVLWAGDSRLYHFHEDDLHMITRDHDGTEALDLPKDALPDRHSNRISRAIGVFEDVEVDVIRLLHAAGDRYLLTTDGVHGVISFKTLTSLVKKNKDLETCLNSIQATALNNLTRDNLSALLVEVA